MLYAGAFKNVRFETTTKSDDIISTRWGRLWLREWDLNQSHQTIPLPSMVPLLPGKITWKIWKFNIEREQRNSW